MKGVLWQEKLHSRLCHFLLRDSGKWLKNQNSDIIEHGAVGRIKETLLVGTKGSSLTWRLSNFEDH
jgi:hypothetical protein